MIPVILRSLKALFRKAALMPYWYYRILQEKQKYLYTFCRKCHQTNHKKYGLSARVDTNKVSVVKTARLQDYRHVSFIRKPSDDQNKENVH